MPLPGSWRFSSTPVFLDTFVHCAGCGMSFWVGDGSFDRKAAEKKHKYYAGNHTFEPRWGRR